MHGAHLGVGVCPQVAVKEGLRRVESLPQLFAIGEVAVVDEIDS